MKILNFSNFQFAPLYGKVNFPADTLTYIVKGAFDLQPESKAEIPEFDDSPYPTGDEYYPDDIDMAKAPLYESDYAHFKPRADLFVVGHCYPPGKKSVQACPVEVQIGPVKKELFVFGNRRWKSTLGIKSITDPEAFDKIPLSYDYSFGGPGYGKNPQGKGFPGKKGENPESGVLPNIEDPAHLIDDPKKTPDPAGFGPLGRMWEQRLSLTGTYDDAWQKNRWPWFPQDMDYGYFNAAPRDMQLDGYLKGDESLFFKNLHPDYPEYHSQLPGIRARCFTLPEGASPNDSSQFQEVSMNLDTLWADMDHEKLILVWRGVTPISSEAYAEELAYVFIMAEFLDDPPASLEACHGLFLDALRREEEEFGEEAEDEMEEADAEDEVKQKEIEPEKDEAPEEAPPEPEIDKSALKQQFKDQSAALMAKMGMDMSKFPPEMQQKMNAQQDEIFDQVLEDDSQKKMARAEAKQKAELSEALSKIGIDVDHPPPLSDKAKKELPQLFKALGVTDPTKILSDPDALSHLTLMGAMMPKMGIDPENLAPFIKANQAQFDKMKTAFAFEEEPE
ncbi:MAG: DUF2169 domain-containing protein, partial [Desulfamplus sp.]|nr:DUF2169 domain-containing protein [Desulfamplus sp.]